MNRPEISINANHDSSVSRHLQWLLISLLLLTLYGCGNSVTNGVDPSGNNSFVGAGSAQNLTADQTAFWNSVHQPVFRQYCKTCHEPLGSGVGEFAHRTDIVQAYNESTGRVNPADPATSLFVTKVASGHNCWVIVAGVPDCAQSAAQLTSAISNWVNADPAEVAADESDSGTTAEIDIVSLLAVPPDVVPVAEQIVLGNVSPPATVGGDEAGYDTHVYGPIVSQYCSNCHSEDANQAQRQQPYFADTDLTAAFNAVVDNRKIDINTPTNSRIYKRLNEDSHNCWTDCATNAATMLAAIQAWKTAIINDPGYAAPVVDGTGTTPLSQGLELGQGQIISGGDRYRRNLVALWEFKEGSGSTVADTSNVSPALDLVLEGVEGSTYDWVGGYGIEFKGGYARGTSTSASQKIYDLISPRNEYTIEAWVVPGNVTQEGPAVIASYSSGANNRNFTMGQTLYSYEFLNRNTASGVPPAATSNGQPTLITDPDDEDLQATQQHVVMTYDSTNGRQIYVNGQLTGDVDSIMGGTLNEWDDGYLFVLGAETNGINNRWLGKLRLVAIYNRALSQEQVTQNFDAGVGQKFNLLFKVGHLTAQLPDESYVWFEVAEFDSNSYLFANPRFVVLGATPTPATFSETIRGMRIGVNGVEAPVGQVFLSMDKTVSYPPPNSLSYEPLIDSVQGTIDGATTMIPVSATGTIISQQNGPNATPADQFYLTFEQLADQTDVRTPPVSSGSIGYNYEAPEAGLADNTYKTGVRMFEEINASMSEVTGVPATTSSVRSVYVGLQQQLPNSPAMEGFLASHQIGIAKLSLAYCGELVDNATLRNAFFPGFPFNETVANAFDTPGEQDIIANALYDAIVIDNVASQPTRTETRDVLFATGTGLLDQLAAGCAADATCTPDSNRTATIVKSMCVTVLSSAALTAQ